MRNAVAVLILQLGIFSFSTAHATNIVLDYSHDLASDNFFGRNPVAKAALDQAAIDISEFLASSLNPIEVGQDPSVGTYLDSSITIDLRLTYDNPSTGQPTTIESPTIGADEVRVFVGMAEINSVTQPNGNDIAGLGSTGSAGFAIGAQGFLNEFGPAIESAERIANETFRRGSTPVNQTISVDNLFDNTAWSVDIELGMIIGTLQLDIDTDNNGITDSDAVMSNFWHFDHTTPVADQKTDFYSVALHEIMHAIGFGSSESWQSLVSGANWNGPQVMALNGGSGAGVLTGDYGHIRQSIVSSTVVDGSTQEPLMTPNILAGTRQYLTDLDLAFLEDIGWEIQSTGLVGDFNNDGDLDLDDINLLTAGTQDNDLAFDLTNDGYTDNDDRVRWVSELKQTWFGDANLDGEFNSRDLIAVFTTNKFETGASALWEDGDWNGDQMFSTSDFIAAFADGGFESGPKLAFSVVPEPIAVEMFLFGLMLVVRRCQITATENSSQRPPA